MLWGIYSAIYGEVNISVEKWVEIKGDYAEKLQSCFISVTLKSWSGRKLLEPTTYKTAIVNRVLINNFKYNFSRRHAQSNFLFYELLVILSQCFADKMFYKISILLLVINKLG